MPQLTRQPALFVEQKVDRELYEEVIYVSRPWARI